MRFILSLLLLLFLADPDRARQANDAYERGDYTTAERGYLDAIRENPGEPRLHFNLGNALAQQGKFDEALEAYQQFRSMARTPEEAALADYNIGNVHSMQEQWDKALDQYRSSLRNNPQDDDAMHNFELALQQLQQQQQQQQDQDQQQSGDQEQEGDQQQQPQSGDQDEDQEGDQEQQSGQQPGEQEEQEQETGQQPQPQTDMSPEEAEQLLNAIRNREKDLIRDFLKDLSEPAEQSEKDW